MKPWTTHELVQQVGRSMRRFWPRAQTAAEFRGMRAPISASVIGPMNSTAATVASSRFTDLVGMPPSTYRRHAARATAGMPSCVAKQVTQTDQNRDAAVTEPHLE